MRMSDLVAQYIIEMLDRENGSAEIQRNELAGNLGCVPSQINYVITSRFTPEKGYIVESRRGGGGRMPGRQRASIVLPEPGQGKCRGNAQKYVAKRYD